MKDAEHNLRSFLNLTITNDTAFTLSAEVLSGSVSEYGVTVPAGQVGLWCSNSSGNSFDDFKLHDRSHDYEVDGRWFCEQGNVTIDNGNNNVLEIAADYSMPRPVVRRGARAGKYVATYRFKWLSGGTDQGFLVRWLDPENWLAVCVASDDSTVRIRRRLNGVQLVNPASGSTVSLTNNTWYSAKVLVDNDTGTPSLQRLRYYIDVDGANGFDEAALIDTTVVDDDWSGGSVGLCRGPLVTANAHQFDDFKFGIDSDTDGTLDSGEVLVDDNFDSAAISLAYDDNGNLTDDGVFKYKYDAWNRLAKVNFRDANATNIGSYAYDGLTRRTSKVVTNNGAENVAGDGGNVTMDFYYNYRWRLLENRNGSDKATRQWVYGTQYVDEIVLMDVNAAPQTTNVCDPDSGESPADKRYFYHQDRNWNVLALTGYGSDEGDVVERYHYTSPYGQFQVLGGVSGSNELSDVGNNSSVGNSLAHQGLYKDSEKENYQNRKREYNCLHERFASRDSLGYLDGINLYQYEQQQPNVGFDPTGNAYASNIQIPTYAKWDDNLNMWVCAYPWDPFFSMAFWLSPLAPPDPNAPKEAGPGTEAIFRNTPQQLVPRIPDPNGTMEERQRALDEFSERLKEKDRERQQEKEREQRERESQGDDNSENGGDTGETDGDSESDDDSGESGGNSETGPAQPSGTGGNSESGPAQPGGTSGDAGSKGVPPTPTSPIWGSRP